MYTRLAYDFKAFGIVPTEQVGKDAVRKNWNKTILTAHPDKGGDEEEFKKLLASKERLDKVYDAWNNYKSTDKDAFINDLAATDPNIVKGILEYKISKGTCRLSEMLNFLNTKLESPEIKALKKMMTDLLAVHPESKKQDVAEHPDKQEKLARLDLNENNYGLITSSDERDRFFIQLLDTAEISHVLHKQKEFDNNNIPKLYLSLMNRKRDFVGKEIRIYIGKKDNGEDSFDTKIIDEEKYDEILEKIRKTLSEIQINDVEPNFRQTVFNAKYEVGKEKYASQEVSYASLTNDHDRELFVIQLLKLESQERLLAALEKQYQLHPENISKIYDYLSRHPELDIDESYARAAPIFSKQLLSLQPIKKTLLLADKRKIFDAHYHIYKGRFDLKKNSYNDISNDREKEIFIIQLLGLSKEEFKVAIEAQQKLNPKNALNLLQYLTAHPELDMRDGFYSHAHDKLEHLARDVELKRASRDGEKEKQKEYLQAGNNDVKLIRLPELPVQVDFKDLADPNKGLLVSESDAKKLREALQDCPDGQYSKKLFEAQMKFMGRNVKWPRNVRTIHKEKDANNKVVLYAFYEGKKHKKELSKTVGAPTTLRLVQTIEDKPRWNAFKIYKAGSLSHAQSEHEKLVAVGLSHGANPEIDNQYESGFAMDYAKGTSLDNILSKKPPQLSNIQLLDIAIQIVELIQDLHRKGFIHDDISLQNFLYDPDTNKVSFSNLDRAHKHGEPRYDLPLMGATLKQIFGISSVVGDAKVSSPFANDTTLGTLLYDMASANPPSLETLRQKLTELRQQVLPISPRTTGIVQVSDYLAAKDKKAFIAALKSVDSVFLAETETDKEKNSLHYSKIRRELEKAGVAVRSEVLVSNDPAKLVSTAQEFDRIRDEEQSLQQQNVAVSRICYFCPEGKAISPTENTLTIEVTGSKRDYRSEILASEVSITPDQEENVIRQLEAQKAKEQDKSASAIARNQAIKAAGDNIKGKNITYSALQKELNNLEKTLTGRTKKQSFSSLVFTKRARAIHTVQKLKRDVHPEASQMPQTPRMKK